MVFNLAVCFIDIVELKTIKDNSAGDIVRAHGLKGSVGQRTRHRSSTFGDNFQNSLKQLQWSVVR